MNKKELPEINEFVIATVKKIFPYGAFCTMDEYDNKEAFIHISEVAPRWIKNIHEFLKDGQKVVAKVHRFVPEKNLIDLSIKRVTEADRKRKLEQSKREKRGEKLLELVSKNAGKTKEQAEKDVVPKLNDVFGDVYTALEEISFSEGEALKKVELPKQWEKSLLEVAIQNIKKPKLTVSATLVLACEKPNGIEEIKKSLSGIKDEGEIAVSVSYLGAPNYKVAVTGSDYKSAETKLESIFASVSESLRKAGGTAEMKKE